MNEGINLLYITGVLGRCGVVYMLYHTRSISTFLRFPRGVRFCIGHEWDGRTENPRSLM